MKKKLLISLCVLPLLFTQPSQASGVPTIDIAAIIQKLKDSLQRAIEFKEKIENAKERLTQAKDKLDHYKDMVDGHFDFETILNDPFLNKHLALDDWKDIYADAVDIADLRDEFNLISDNPSIQARFDKQLQSYKATNDFYSTAVKRSEKLGDLLDEFALATNPAAKADLANSIQFENTQVENDGKLMETMSLLMQQKEAMEKAQIEVEKMNTLNGVGIPVDYSTAYEGIE